MRQYNIIFAFLSTVFASVPAHSEALQPIQRCGDENIVYSINNARLTYFIKQKNNRLVPLSSGELTIDQRKFNLLSTSQKEYFLSHSNAPRCLNNRAVAFEKWRFGPAYPERMECVWIYDLATKHKIKTALPAISTIELESGVYRGSRHEPWLDSQGYTFVFNEILNCD